MNNSLKDAIREIAILKKLSHRNIINLYEIIHNDDKGKIYLISELADKGNIMNYNEDTGEFSINTNLTGNDRKYYTEDEIKDLFRDIVCGLDYRM